MESRKKGRSGGGRAHLRNRRKHRSGAGRPIGGPGRTRPTAVEAEILLLCVNIHPAGFYEIEIAANRNEEMGYDYEKIPIRKRI